MDLYFIEYNANCAEKWAYKTDRAHVFTGDQANVTFLEEFIAISGGEFDLIIDDGGHTMSQQMTSLKTLWRAVKPGGIFFIEDLHTSYMPVYGGDEKGINSLQLETERGTASHMIYELIEDKHREELSQPREGKHHAEISEDTRSIDCMKCICAITKMIPNEL